MVRALRSQILAIILLCFCVNLAIADQRVARFHRRQEPGDSSSPTRTPSRTLADDPSAIITSRPSETGEGTGRNDGDSSSKTGDRPGRESVSITSERGSKSNSTSSSRSASPTEVVVSVVTSNIKGAAETDSYTHAKYNSTTTPDLLPITPDITPGFAVGGVILMLSGLVFTLVGIKNKFLHIFLSAAYLASVSVTVLILYVMNPPVSNAVQGAYLVAVVMTGLILGGAAIVFTEMTEGLGCLLGGFCFSMWLLVLKPGGLIRTTSGKSIFIAAFTLAAFATSFSHYTRDYGLIVSISFGGATAVVLGIDCFSRAGLKEFWAYLWDLNTNLFPIGATSYPLTRGMKVEIAAIVIIFLAGIVSQMKLWKVIKERREQRAAERLQDERTMEQEEENVGRRIEHRNAQERGQWEAVYGDKDVVPANTDPSSRDSGVGDMESQKKGARSTVTSIRRSREDEIEMSEMASPTLATGAGLVIAKHGQEGGAVTVRVARDPEPLADIDENRTSLEHHPNRLSHISARSSRLEQSADENVWVVGADGEARLERRSSQRNSKRASNSRVSGIPEVVPLPFTVPLQEDNANDDRSSVATFADEDHNFQKRNSKHLSAGSAILRRLSERSKRNSGTFSRGEGVSTEDLVIPRAVEAEDDRASSVAATMDGLSDDGDMRSIRSSFEKAPDTDEARSPLDLPPPVDMRIDQQPSPSSRPASKIVIDEPEGTKTRPILEATEATNILSPEISKDENIEELVIKPSLTSSTDPKPQSKSPLNLSASEEATQDTAKKDEAAQTVISAAETNPASITKERLPPQLSKVVMSYRTNEWAKHLSGADTPEVNELKIEEYPVESETRASEVAAPVNVEALQQTAENAAPFPAPRSASQTLNHVAPPLTRSGSSQSKLNQSPYQSRPETSNGTYQDISQNISKQSLYRQSSQQSINTRAMGFRSSSNPAIPQPIVESPVEDATSTSPKLNGADKFSPQLTPFGSTTTLIGKRDTMLRSKSSYYGNGPALSSTPEFPHHSTGANSDAGSVYNYPNNSTPMITSEEEHMSLAARRDLIRQSSTPMAPLQQIPVPFDSHQPRRQPSAPSPLAREQQLASWRANVAQDLQSTAIPKHTIERSRSALWQERQAEEHRRATEAKKKGDRNSAFDARMRRGDMLDAHREALRKMQASANKHA